MIANSRKRGILHVHRYIHLNPVIGYIVEKLEDYPWSSYREYISAQSGFCEKEIILNQFSSLDAYKEFLFDQIEYGRTLSQIKHQLLDFEE